MDTFPLCAKDRVSRLKSTEAVINSVAGIRLLQKLTGTDLVLKSFAYSESGKPYLKHDRLEFSISHSGNFTVCAFNMNGLEIGVDTEWKKRDVSTSYIRKILTKSELEEVSGTEAENKICEIWTRKESVSKLLGIGLQMDFKEIHTWEGSALYMEKVFTLTPLFSKDHENVTTLASLERVSIDSQIVTLDMLGSRC